MLRKRVVFFCGVGGPIFPFPIPYICPYFIEGFNPLQAEPKLIGKRCAMLC